MMRAILSWAGYAAGLAVLGSMVGAVSALAVMQAGGGL